MRIGTGYDVHALKEGRKLAYIRIYFTTVRFILSTVQMIDGKIRVRTDHP